MFNFFKRKAQAATHLGSDLITLVARAEAARSEGDLAGSLRCYDQIILIKPGYALAHYRRGNILKDLGRLHEAISSYDQAIVADSEYANAFCNRGVVLERLNRLVDARRSYERAITLNATDAVAHYNRGSVLRALGCPDEALASYGQAIELDPTYAEAFCNRGILLTEQNNWPAALASYEKAIEINPNFSEAYLNRGDLLLKQQRFDDALASYDRAIEINPAYAEAYCNRGTLFSSTRRLDAALANFNKAIELRPNLAEAYRNRAALFAVAQLDEKALADCEVAMALDPENPDAHHLRGVIFSGMKRFEDAIASFDRVFQLSPNFAFLLGTRLHTKMIICDWNGLESDLLKISEGIEAGQTVSSPMPVLALLDSARLHHKCAKIFVTHEYENSEAPLATPPATTRAQFKIRIGYFSADFHIHPVAVLMARVFESHDRSKFEIVAFSFGPATGDDFRRRLEGSFDRFIDVRGNSDVEIAGLARSLNIDIAVDLSGYTANGRPMIFVHRAAPVQINFLGYPGTIGAKHMDYLVGDETLIPADNQIFYDEKIIYLPNGYLPSDPTRQIAERVFNRTELGLPPDGFVYCCFNNSYKITPYTFDSWMRILEQVPGSVLWLSQNNSSAMHNLRSEAARRNIDDKRLVFAERVALSHDHLARHQAADLFLDTLPYNAHATAMDALWAGLPILTCMGDGFAGRVAASLLRGVGLTELIVPSMPEYERVAVQLATDSQRLERIRENLRAHRVSSVMFDAESYARRLEMAYNLVHDRVERGLPPDHMVVPKLD